MLGGIDPVIIFQLRKRLDFASLTNAEFMALSVDELEGQFVDLPPIPVYLSETIFNIVINGESKSVDIETVTDTLTDGSQSNVNQKGIQSSIQINIEGTKDNVALTLLSALIDVAFEKATSKEYWISYLHGATTIFRGVLQSYNVETVEGTDKLAISLGLSRGQKNPTKPDAIPSVPSSIGPIPGG